MWIKIKESHPCFWFFSDSLLNLYKIQSLYSLKYPTWCSTVHIVKITLSHFPHPLIITKWTNVSSYHPKLKKKKKQPLSLYLLCSDPISIFSLCITILFKIILWVSSLLSDYLYEVILPTPFGVLCHNNVFNCTDINL